MQVLLICVIFSLTITIIVTTETSTSEGLISKSQKSNHTLCSKRELPKVPFGKLLKIVRYRNKRKSTKGPLVAIYSCEDGFSLSKNISERLFCRNGKWTGKTPICEKSNSSSVLNTSSLSIKNYSNKGNSSYSNTDPKRSVSSPNDHTLLVETFELNNNFGRDDRDHGNSFHNSEVLCTYRYIDSSEHMECVCPDGYTLSSDLSTCKDIDECTSGLSDCDHICTNTPGSYKCQCKEGFNLLGDGRTCEDIDECASITNNCSQLCINSIGSFSCGCFEGFSLKDNGQDCVDNDECHPDVDNVCSQKCVNTQGSYYCSCFEGYDLDSDQKTCKDVDECSLRLCSQKCVNSLGSYKCDCKKGFKLSRDNHTCIDDNECLEHNGNCSHLCANSEGSYQCACPSGFVLTSDGKNCKKSYACSVNNGGCSHYCSEDNGSSKCFCPYDMELVDDFNCGKRKQCSTKRKDECYSCNVGEKILLCFCPSFTPEVNGNTSVCPLNYELFSGISCRRMDANVCKRYNENGISRECVLIEETKACLCPEDYYIKNGKCVSFDPCFINNGGCSHICENIDGKASCNCPSGLVLQNNSCVKQYSCQINNGGCSHFCKETQNGTRCSCPKGFHLSDGETCVDSNPCSKDNGGCSHICKNVNGRPLCKCPHGFVMRNKTCLALNSCAYSNGGCSHFCVESHNEVKCSCPEGFYLTGKTCSEQNPCLAQNGNCSHFCNISQENNQFCSCPKGLRLGVDQKSCEDINECEENRCSHICENTHGGFLCRCPEGFHLLEDKLSCSRRSDCSEPLIPQHGKMTCSYNGDQTLTKCVFSCEEGYELQGEEVLVCGTSGRWSSNTPRCIFVNTSEFYIRCPNNGKLNFTLPLGQSSMNVWFPKPITSVDWWRQVSSDPFWGKYLNRHLPVGETKIIFKAHDGNMTTSCELVINVSDNEPPKVYNCPLYIQDVLPKTKKSKLLVWQEPTFTDNVKISSIYKSKSPGSEFYLGKEEVIYEASDEAGNKAVCKFSVELKEMGTSNVKPYFYKNVLICPSGVRYMSESPDYYDFATIKSFGCRWKYVRVYPMSKQQWYFNNYRSNFIH